MTDANTQIEYVLNHFDFDLVRDTMTYFGWEWTDSALHAPSYNELRRMAKSLLEKVVLRDGVSARIHQLEARSEDGKLELQFVLTHAGYYE